jgi:hypothetical protein
MIKGDYSGPQYAQTILFLYNQRDKPYRGPYIAVAGSTGTWLLKGNTGKENYSLL